MKTNKKDFKLFKSECLKWANKFELNNWNFEFYHENLDKHGIDGAMNITHFDLNADLYLDTDITCSTRPKREEILIAAKHEMIHVLLGRLETIAMSRYITKSEFTSVDEELVHKLTNLIK